MSSTIFPESEECVASIDAFLTPVDELGLPVSMLAASVEATPAPDPDDERRRSSAVMQAALEYGDRIGTGFHGDVWPATDATSGQRYAVKEFRSAAALKQEVSAIRFATGIQTDCIVMFHGFTRQTPTGHPGIVLERMEGSVASLLEANGSGLPVPFVQTTARSIARALHACAVAGVTHRDVRPANFLHAGSRVVLADFGLAALDGHATDFVGSAMYMAPERLQGKLHGPASDVWSLGICVAELLLGEHPFVATGLVNSAQLDTPEGSYWALFEVMHLSDDIETPPVIKHIDAVIDSAVIVPLSQRFGDDAGAFVRACIRAHPNARATPISLLSFPFVSTLGADIFTDVADLVEVLATAHPDN